MSEQADALRLVVEIDIDGFVRAGIADFQGQPHLFVSECLDWDNERLSRRLGATFFLVPLPGAAAEAFLREDSASVPRDGDPEWQPKQDRRWARWLAFKQSWLQPAPWAWRARGNFRAVEGSRNRSVRFCWLLSPGRRGRVSGEELRSRLAHLEELERVRSGNPPEHDVGEELPF
jgi:hypothetical protein